MKAKMKLTNAAPQKGQSLVELAISLMVILMLLLGAVEFSLALFQYVTIRDAAQEGALYGSINPTDDTGIRQRVAAAASDVVTLDPTDTSQIEVTRNNGLSCEGLTGGVPNAIIVAVNFQHPITFPLVGPMIGSNEINLRASVTNTILSPSCP
jgi:Flp pilus assembly protein TadG